MAEQTTEAAPEVTDGPAETTNLMTEALEATEQTESPEQTETVDATDGENQGEQASAPESYEFTAPEGVEVAKDSAVVAAYSEFAKSHNLTQEQAQAGFENLAKAQATQQAAANSAQLEAWAEETRNDPELGGANLKHTMVKVAQFAATFGDADLQALLDTGLGNNLAVVRALAKARDAISDDNDFVTGNQGETARKKDARDLYPNSEMNP